MALYRNAYRDELEDEVLENEEDGQSQTDDKSNLETNENDPYSKRYADLRRGSQKALSAKDQEIKALRDQLSAAEKANVKYPKSEDEVKAWLARYPDVGGIVETIVLKKLADYDTGKTPQFDRVKELEEQIARDRTDRLREIAISEILAVHPDFNSLVDDTTEKGKKFHAWVADQDDWVKYALYENETKSKPAIDAVDLYKSRNKGYDKNDRKDAAKSVSRQTGGAPKDGSNFRFSDSMVEKMTPQEYAKYEQQIDEAIRNGEYEYDLAD